MAGRLAQTDIAGHDGSEHPVAEVLFDLVHHLNAQVGPAVQHGQHHAQHLKVRVQTLSDQVQRVHQLPHALQRVVFALNGHQHASGRGQRVQRDQPKRRRAVDQDVIILAAHLVYGAAQNRFPDGTAN
ncbi:hypothetical protein SDC9_132222 [bioreactor metagenome]|uniref:Uncharacterized protein n=1 Tax=bioreactor metagenome TaxID=1076179 RepID=A0A645D7G3_9ZZZZ